MNVHKCLDSTAPKISTWIYYRKLDAWQCAFISQLNHSNECAEISSKRLSWNNHIVCKMHLVSSYRWVVALRKRIVSCYKFLHAVWPLCLWYRLNPPEICYRSVWKFQSKIIFNLITLWQFDWPYSARTTKYVVLQIQFSQLANWAESIDRIRNGCNVIEFIFVLFDQPGAEIGVLVRFHFLNDCDVRTLSDKYHWYNSSVSSL